jgi:hypothetical protein
MNDEQRPPWLEQQLVALPRDLTPARDLWPGIAVRITRSRRPWRALAVAAGIVLSAAALLIAYRSDRTATAVPASKSALAQWTVVVEPYAVARTSYRQLWRERRGALDPVLIAEVERNLTILAGAEQALRSSLERDPDDPRLLAQLSFALQQEVDLLRQMSATPRT